MTKKEKLCKNMADVCELAHERTVRECRKSGTRVDCTSEMFCRDNDRHGGDDDEVHYTSEAQEVFDRHYNHITSVTGI